jgi:hypothetical protein
VDVVKGLADRGGRASGLLGAGGLAVTYAARAGVTIARAFPPMMVVTHEGVAACCNGPGAARG